MIVLTIAVGLAAPAAASGLTPSQARQAVANQLAKVYGTAWLQHTPSWSQPECEPEADYNPPGVAGCETEFEYAGVWHYVGATVSGGAVQFWYPRHWVRRWGSNSATCDRGFVIVGQLSSNNGTCFALTLWQNFAGVGRSHRTVIYTGFKRQVVIYAAGSLIWPDFNVFSCSLGSEAYQCTNRFGDGFRWKPYASACAPETLDGFGRSVRLQFALGGRVSCNQAHRTMRTYFQDATPAHCRTAGNICGLTVRGGWHCALPGAASEAPLVAGCFRGSSSVQVYPAPQLTRNQRHTILRVPSTRPGSTMNGFPTRSPRGPTVISRSPKRPATGSGGSPPVGDPQG